MMTQEEAMNMSNEQAVRILIPMRNMMCDQNGCPISDAVFALDKAIEALSANRPQGDVDAVDILMREMHNLDQGYITIGEFDERIEPLRHLCYGRPKGVWIPMEVSSGRESWKCSVCGRRTRGKLKNLPYCHCGARMLPPSRIAGNSIDQIIIDESMIESEKGVNDDIG